MMRGGMFQQPSHRVIEEGGPRDQVGVPILKAWVGLPGSICIAGLGLIWWLYLVPPDAALTFLAVIFASGAVAAGWIGMSPYLVLDLSTVSDDHRDKINTRAQWALTAFAGAGGLTWLMGQMPKGWWGVDATTWDVLTSSMFVYALQFVVSIALFFGGAFGAYWFQKEIRIPWELTGRDKAVHSLEMAKLAFEQEKWHYDIEPPPPQRFEIQYLEPAGLRAEGAVGNSGLFLSFKKVTPTKFTTWARTILSTKKPDLTYDQWEGKGRLFSRLEYDELTEELSRPENRVLIQQRGSTGYTITARGRRLLETWLGSV